MERLYEPVGRIVLYWGFIDIAMTDIPLKMFQVLKTPSASHDLRHEFGARLKVVKKHLGNRSEFASVRDDGLQAIEGIREAAIAQGLIAAASFDAGIRDLYRTTEAGGVFCYTFFKGVAVKP